MTTEERWYSSYHTVRRRGGEQETVPPLCRRLSRLPAADQWRAVIDLAIEWAMGAAGWRYATIAKTGERYWWFRGGWWLVSRRIEERARLVVEAARLTARRRQAARGFATCSESDIAAVLCRWRTNHHWRGIAAGVGQRRAQIASAGA